MAVAYLFPGQGSQSIGMGRSVYEQSASARALFERADDYLGFALSDLCFTGDAEQLTATENQQPALFVTSLAQYAAMQEHPDRWPRPAYMAGHSLGEITALTAAQSLSFLAGLEVVRQRGRLMKLAGEQATGAMSAVLGLNSDQLAQICATATAQSEAGHLVVVANDNSPKQTVLSGHKPALALAETLAKEAGARKIVRLGVTIGSHSPLMETIVADFQAILEDIPINSPQIPVISNITAEPLPAPRRIRTELTQQLVKPVRWRESILNLTQRGVDSFVEVGPGTVLTGLLKRIDNSVKREAFVPEER